MSILGPGTRGAALDWDSGNQLKGTPSTLSINDKKLGQSTVAKLGLLTKAKIKNCKKEEKDKTGASLAYASVLKRFEPKLEEAQRNELLRRMVSSDKLQ